MKRIFLLLTVLSALGISALAQPLHIAGRQWKLVELNGSPIGTSNAYIEFEKGETKFSGHSGCNRMFGGVEIRGRRIVFSNVGTTRMACADPRAQKTESAFLRELKNINSFRQSGNDFELLIGKRVVMRFVGPVKLPPVRTPETGQLEGKKWVLESIAGGNPVSKIGRTAFIVFDKAKGSAGGNSSCNVFGGSYSSKDGTLKITEIMSTMRACVEDERMDIERRFLDGLRNTDRYEFEDGKLMLYRNDGVLLTLTGEPK